MEHPEHSKILHDHAVQPLLIEIHGKIHRLLKFALLGEDVQRQIHLPAENLGVPDGPYYVFLCEVFRVCPGAEFLSAQVDRVRAGFERAQKGLPAAGGRQQFRKLRPPACHLDPSPIFSSYQRSEASSALPRVRV